jgi:diacylglycerol kinase family enzyme
MNILAILNPISGGIDKTEIRSQIEEACASRGHELQIFETTGEGDKEKIQGKIDRQAPDRLLSIGGDGTFLMVAEVIGQKNIPVGIIPMGSANGLAKELEIPMEPKEALKVFLDSDRIDGLDVLCVNDKYRCVHIGDIGLNAEIVKGFEKDAGRGMLAYSKQVVKALSKLEAFEYRLYSGDKLKKEGMAVMLGIGNGKKFGTGIPLSKNGNPFDGKFEIVVIEEVRPGNLLRQGLSAINEAFLEESDFEEFQFEKCRIEFQKPQILQLDGEIIGKIKELKIIVEAGKVKLISSSSNPYPTNKE